jgi:hypothetical protein
MTAPKNMKKSADFLERTGTGLFYGEIFLAANVREKDGRNE